MRLRYLYIAGCANVSEEPVEPGDGLHLSFRLPFLSRLLQIIYMDSPMLATDAVTFRTSATPFLLP